MATAATTLQRVRHSVAQPCPVAPQLFVLLAIVPIYIFIPGFLEGRVFHSPELALDRMVPLLPAWSLVYGALYAFLIVVPGFVVRERGMVHRLFSAYLAVWLISYAVFFIYPTRAPRPPAVVGEGFAAWGLRFLYDADPPYNCLPSIHVAHSFVSALACYSVHRKVGAFTLVCATLVAMSTLFTKQHYVLDLVGGVLLALVCYRIFASIYPGGEVLPDRHRLAPTLAACVFAIAASGILGAWIVYRFELV